MSAPLPGAPVTTTELADLGFAPFELAFEPQAVVALAEGSGCRWSTVGNVPDSPGLYAFTVGYAGALHVVYVDLTTHLWMVTKGRLPRSGGARPGQRYGWPTYAGSTRRRVNVAVAEQVTLGRTVTHWLSPRPAEVLRAEEEQLIVRCDCVQPAGTAAELDAAAFAGSAPAAVAR